LSSWVEPEFYPELHFTPSCCTPQVEELLRESLVLQSCMERSAAGQSGMGPLLERLLPKRLKQYQKGVASASQPAPSAASQAATNYPGKGRE
jgi:hypothetical protein